MGWMTSAKMRVFIEIRASAILRKNRGDKRLCGIVCNKKWIKVGDVKVLRKILTFSECNAYKCVTFKVMHFKNSPEKRFE